MRVRPATVRDADAMLAIYAPVVRETAISFELDVPAQAEFEGRIERYGRDWAWLVAEEAPSAERGGRLLGYAYGSPHRERQAYRWSTETSVYVAEAARGRGVGRQLYAALLPALAAKGYCNAYAGIALPNAASVALHTSVGFASVGRFPNVGRKFGRWHDIGWYHRALRDLPLDEA